MNTVEKIIEILSNQELWNKFAGCTSKEEAAALLAQNGVEASVEEIREAVMQMVEKKPEFVGQNGELSDEDMEQVAGGLTNAIIRFLHWLFD